MSSPVEILDDDTRWAAAFADFGAVLREVLGNAAFRIDPIGSTAAPGLAAKSAR
jgi:GrpB-like predicted nucleotidyltransferase (UPF0157 family)